MPFFLGLQAKYLQDKFPDVEIGAAIPRLRPYGGNFKADSNISDKNVVQIITALRIFLPAWESPYPPGKAQA